jgi:integrase
MGSAIEHWSYKAGEKGRNRVRVYEDNKTGIILAEFYEDGKRKRVSLGHRDRAKAKQQADDIAAAIGKAETISSPVDVTLRELFDIYGSEVTPGKSRSKQVHDVACSEMFLRFLGPERKAITLSRRDVGHFVRKRRSGQIAPAGKRENTAVGNRQIEYDLKWLLSVLNWATWAGNGRGEMLLKHNPLKGVPLPKEENPNRPIITEERYQAMLRIAGLIDWRFEVALILANETGHRIKAIRELRWTDVDLESGTMRWRADSDKIGFQHYTPLTDKALRALETARESNPGRGRTWVLPSPSHPAKPCSRNILRDWWYRAEELAELEHVKGLAWHGLRRKFATEMKDVPLKDLCQLGGWKEPQTILKCYQRADEDRMREALRARRSFKAAVAY